MPSVFKLTVWQVFMLILSKVFMLIFHFIDGIPYLKATLLAHHQSKFTQEISQSILSSCICCVSLVILFSNIYTNPCSYPSPLGTPCKQGLCANHYFYFLAQNLSQDMSSISVCYSREFISLPRISNGNSVSIIYC